MEYTKGYIVAGTYRLDMLIAKGGMGLVYKGTHIRLGKEVAVKLLLREYVQYKDKITRFLNEAMGIANLRHRHIVNMEDMGLTDEGVPFFVMEYLKGESLRDRLKRHKRLSVSESTRILMQTLSGLAALHNRRVIHRDLKPSNIFLALEADGTEIVKILDFGVSKFHIVEDGETQDMTAPGDIMGTPSFMSPEQARGRKKDVDFRTDIYSAGMVLYRCIAGVNPLRGETDHETINNILEARIPPPSYFEPSLPKELDQIVVRAMARDKRARPQSCYMFMHSLRPFVDEQDLAALDPSDTEETNIMIPLDVEGGEARPKKSAEFLLKTPAGVMSSSDFGTSTSISDYKPRSRRGAGVRLWAAAAAASAAAAILVLLALTFLGGGKKEGTDSNTAREQEAPATVEKEDETGAGEDRTCTLDVDGIPPSAVVSVDGVAHEERPVVLEKKAEPRRVRIEAEGFEPWEKTMVMQADVILSVTLAPLAGSRDGAAKSASGSSKYKAKKTKTPLMEGSTGVKKKKTRKILTDYPGL